jgi:plastocyanin
MTWVNADDIPHVVSEKNGAFRSSALDTNDAFTQTFPTAGTIEYFCPIHPHDRKDHRDALKWRYTEGSATSTG